MAPLQFKNEEFNCRIKCRRCIAKKANGDQCNNRTCLSSPRCWLHSKKKYGVFTRQSPGLFADKDFNVNDWICPYRGETIADDCLQARYPGNMAAPYAVRKVDGDYIDAACKRGVAANSKTRCGLNGQTLAKAHHNAEIQNRNHVFPKWLVAIQHIQAGEEIFTWSGAQYECDRNHSTGRSTRPNDDPCAPF